MQNHVVVTVNAPKRLTVLMLTALPVEITAVLAHVSGDRSAQMNGHVLCETGYFTSSDGSSWRVVAAEIGAGTVDTAGAVVAITSQLRPDMLMFVGIAGALKNGLNIGDVVAGAEVAWTERGKWSQSGYLPRIRTVSLSAPLVQLARKIARDGSWRRRLTFSRPGAIALVGQIASGEKVVADDEYRGWLRAVFSDALAVENEGYALARAAEVYTDVQRYVVRGISDNADGSKTDDGHARAADAAAAFAFELVDAYSQAQVLQSDEQAFSIATVHSGQPVGVISRSRDPSVGAPARRSAGRTHYAFISYVREDSPAIDRLQEALESADVHVWRDVADLWPGQDRQTAIRQAITSDAFVFLACFSQQSLAQAKTRQNEELTLAIDQMRLRSPDQSWLIPIRLDDCRIPDRDIGGGRTLASIQGADLFGEGYEQNLARLIAAITRKLERESAGTSHRLPDWRAHPNAPVSDVDSSTFRSQLPDRPVSPKAMDPPAESSAMNHIDQPDVTGSIQQLRVLHRPPDLVPTVFLDRDETLTLLLQQLRDQSNRFVALVGDHGVGKTAVVTALLDRLTRSRPIIPFSAFEYFSTRGNQSVNVPMLIDILAMAHPEPSVRYPLRESINQPGSSWWEKLDRVIRELSTTRVLIVADNGEKLLDDRGEIADRPVREFVEYLSKHASHAVQLLFVTSAPPEFRLRGFSPDDALRIPAELPLIEDRLKFIASLAPSSVSQESRRMLCNSAGGRPRTLELVSGILAESNGDVAALMRVMREPRPEMMAPELLDRILYMLPESEARVLLALAIFGRPVPAVAVSRLLDRDCEASITRLARRRFVRVNKDTDTDTDSFYLPPYEGEHLLSRIEIGEPADRTRHPRPWTRIALWHHAASYFADVAENTNVRRVEDLGPHFGAIDLQVRAGDHDSAFDLMNKIEDEHLEGWGHTDALSQFREKIESHLGDATDEVNNLTRMAYALNEQEQHDRALEVLQRARRRNDDFLLNAALSGAERQHAHNELVILSEEAGANFEAGKVTIAKELYERALLRPCEPEDKAALHSDLGLCLIEMAYFDDAIQQFEIGLELIGGRSSLLSEWVKMTLNKGLAQLYRDPIGDVAVATLKSAKGLADDLDDRVLAAQCADALALATIGIDDDRALALAKEAAAVGVETGRPGLAREANGTLALIHLRLRNIDDALAAADVAVEFGRSRRGFSGYVWRGIALLRRRDPDQAEYAFMRASSHASGQLGQESNCYQIYEFAGLAQAGLAVATRSDDLVKEAENSYLKARKLTMASGVIRLCVQKLDALLAGIDDPKLSHIRAVAGGYESQHQT